MGTRGPAPTPAKLKLLHGNPGKRPIANEPDIPDGAPDPPDWEDVFPMPPGRNIGDPALADVARNRQEAAEMWEATVPILEAAYLIKPTDYAALVEYCVTWAKLRQAVRLVSQTSLLFTTERGAAKNPAVDVEKGYRRDLQMYMRELGLTPSARLRLSIPDSSPVSDAINRVLD